jgi:hypothetical protein
LGISSLRFMARRLSRGESRQRRTDRYTAETLLSQKRCSSSA